jgi:hypothetical protein
VEIASESYITSQKPSKLFIFFLTRLALSEQQSTRTVLAVEYPDARTVNPLVSTAISRCTMARPWIVSKLRAYPDPPATSPELQNFTLHFGSGEADPTAAASGVNSDGAVNLWIAEEAKGSPQDRRRSQTRLQQRRRRCRGGQLMDRQPQVGSGGTAAVGPAGRRRLGS